MKLVLSTILLALCTVRGAAASSVATNAAALAAALSRAESGCFDLEATVTFSGWTNNVTLAVEDASGAVTVVRDATNLSTRIRSGDRIRLTGRTDARLWNATFAKCTSIALRSHGECPRPMSCDASSLLSGRLDHRLVEIRGMVRDAFRDEIDPMWYFLVVKSGGDDIYAAFQSACCGDANLEALVNAEVSISGLCAPINPGYRRQIGRILLVSGTDAIRLIRRQPDNPFDVPDISVLTGLRPSEISSLGRHKVQGRVDAVWHGDSVILRVAGDSFVRVDLARPVPPAYGDTIEAVGLPETDLYRINLTRASWRHLPKGSSTEPMVNEITAARLLKDETGRQRINSYFYGRTVRIRGIVRKLPAADSADGRFYVECDSELLPVDVSARPSALAGIDVNCEVEVTGAFVAETGNWHPNSVFPRVKETFLVIRTPQDIRVLWRPSWWTPGRLLSVIGSLLAALTAILVWNASLRRIAERRGRQLFKEQVARAKSEMRIEERTRLAVELHDSMSQNLTGISMQIDAAGRTIDKDRNKTLRHLGIASRTLDSCREELRNCIWDLRSQALEEQDMNEAIRKTVLQHTDGAKLSIRFNVPRKRLSDNTAHALMRIVRELTTNAVRHGGARLIRIAGALDNGELLFSVTDDGCGFDPENRPGIGEGHFGLQGIAERIKAFGGTFRIESAPGKGSRISISLKIPGQMGVA